MDPQFGTYFSRRISGQAQLPIAFAEEIHYLADMLGDQRGWREDAYYFLFYTVFIMLLAPLRGVGDPRYPGPFTLDGEVVFAPELEEALRSDLLMVAELARIVAKERGREYISSTSVAMALGRVAGELKTSGFRIWGRSSEGA